MSLNESSQDAANVLRELMGKFARSEAVPLRVPGENLKHKVQDGQPVTVPLPPKELRKPLTLNPVTLALWPLGALILQVKHGCR
ncbi:MAG TPA: hypothetical protein VJX23_12065 [Candidatus Binataceae bacterium]|nr:hypothetical protein [Candidatus Binataceae bacterium]